MNEQSSHMKHPNPKKATVLVMIDGLRPDYVHPASMPFLSGLSKQGATGFLEPTPGRSQDVALLMGKYPDTAQFFESYGYHPEKIATDRQSGFHKDNRAEASLRLRPPLRLAHRRSLVSSESIEPAWVPGRHRPFLRPVEANVFSNGTKAKHSSVFYLCDKNGVEYQWFIGGSKGKDQAAFEALVRALREAPAGGLFVIKLKSLEQAAFLQGPFSHTVQTRTLRALDEKLASIHAAMTSNHDHWAFMACGTRAMAPVERQVDVLSTLREADAKPGEDYVVFVGDTLMRVWYRSKRGHREIEYLLPRIEGTYSVDEKERRRLRIPKGRLGGDHLLAARPGVLFSPSFFHSNGNGLLGMNGYLDKETENHPPLVVVSSGYNAGAKKLGLRPMVDVYPTLCELIGVRLSGPQEGESLASTIKGPTWSQGIVREEPSNRVVHDA